MRARMELSPSRPTLRLDKWLVQARFFRTRTLASEMVDAGHVRVNGIRMAKPAHPVGAGDTLTFAQGDRIRLVRIVGVSVRRGPPEEAQALYDDLDHPAAEEVSPDPDTSE